jgi:citrate lyase subunit beta / citryl-CoA lyase
MRLRSLLFVPGDRPDRMSKALASGADALVLDLEDSVLPGAKAGARTAVADFLAQPRSVPLFVRVNPVSALMDQDLEVVVPHAPDGIMLPKAEGGYSVASLDKRLVVHGNNDARILPIATETPSAVFALGSYGGVSGRLCGLTWGAEDLPAAIGAVTSRTPEGDFTAPYEMLRSLTLFGAHAAGVAAIETVYPAIGDADGLAVYAGRGRRDGFSGMLAIHPTQVPVINAAFTPSQAEIEWAHAVVDAFARNPGAGVIQHDGRMLDAPHLKQAQAVLEQAGP